MEEETAKQHQMQRRVTPGEERQVKCDVCGRLFRRESDKARHKCKSEQEKPISEQTGSVQCQRCKRWFRSKGGFTIHRCET